MCQSSQCCLCGGRPCCNVKRGARNVLCQLSPLPTADHLQENVTAVLTRSPVDVLSHVAIRARSQGVFLATCFDEGQMGGLLEQQGQYVMLTINASGSVEATPVDASAQQGSNKGECT